MIILVIIVCQASVLLPQIIDETTNSVVSNNGTKVGFSQSTVGFNDTRAGFKDTKAGFKDTKAGYKDTTLRGGEAKSTLLDLPPPTAVLAKSIESFDQTTPSSDLNQNTPHENLPAKDGADGNNTKLQIGAKSDLKDLEESSLSLNPLLSLPKSLSQVNQVPDLIQFNNKKTCSTNGKCLEPNKENILCFGTDLGYKQSSLALSGLDNQSELVSMLKDWEALKQVPSCWKEIQPLLCGVYFPSCANGTVNLVPTDLCKVARSPCRVLSQLNPKWENLLDCQSSRYSDCRIDEKSERLRFNTSTSCPPPLISTQNAGAYFWEIDECGLGCASPLLSSQEYTRLKMFIGVAGAIALVSTLAAVCTFLIDWSGANKYPAVAIFYINVCFCLATLGWMAQLVGKDDIVCRSDGGVRLQEPGSGENLSCVVVFILVYYFTLAGGVWLVILTYTWSVFFTSNAKVKDLIDPKTAYFHMGAWTFPAVLTIIIMAMNQVEASSVYGICYIGFQNTSTRIIFLLLPYSLFAIAGAYYSGRCILFLSGVYFTPDFLSEKESYKVKATLLRIGFFSVMTAVLILVSFLCQIYEFLNIDLWKKSIEELVICNLKSQIASEGRGLEECGIQDRPNQTLLELQLLCMFGAGLLASSWVYTKESMHSWRLFLQQLITRRKSQRPLRLKKHEMIAQAFSKRRELQENGRLSLTLQSAHVDPLGMNVELGDDSSGDISSTWAAALPYLVQRRGGVCGAEQLGLGRRNSLDSLNSSVSQSVSIRSRFSLFDSRKQSVDSQSLFNTDLERLQSIYDNSVKKTGRKSKRDFFKSHAQKVRPWSRLSRRSSASRRDSSYSRNRRDSSYSRNSRNSDNSINSQILPAITLDPAKLKLPKHRRSEYSVPEPGKSTDFGRPRTGILPTDPTYRELEEKLRHLANISRTSNNTLRDGSLTLKSAEVQASFSRSVQTSLTDLSSLGQRVHPSSTGQRVHTASTGTQMSLNLLSSSTTPLQHIEANVVSIKVCGPSSEDSSIPSSLDQDIKLRRLVGKGRTGAGKENTNTTTPSAEEAETELTVARIEIPALKQHKGGPLIKPRDHNRGRRGAIVEKISPKAEAQDNRN